MSLSVSTYSVDAERRMVYTVGDKPWESPEWRLLSDEERFVRLRNSRSPGGSMGPESWREKVWGSSLLISLGLHLLPRLATRDLYAVDDDINVLKDELRVVARNVEEVAKMAGCLSQEIAQYLENVTVAIEEAECINGGVVIR